MKKIQIKTNLKNRGEVFKLIALGQATGFPILLEGIPGVGKTRAILDYASGVYRSGTKPLQGQLLEQEVLKNVFILETDESTKGSVITGRPDIKKLVETKIYENYAPITDAKFIFINEVDKAAGMLKNSLLSVMNEKHLFNGKEITPCNWEVFAATCNEIPKEELGSPFWDRFVLKMNLARLSESELLVYCTNPKAEEKFELYVPAPVDIEKMKIPKDKLGKIIKLVYSKLSDRNISYLPILVPCVSAVYQVSMNKALVKTTELLADYQTSRELSKVLEPEELTKIRGQIDLLPSFTDYNQILNTVANIDAMIRAAAKSGIASEADLKELALETRNNLKNNAVYQNQMSNVNSLLTPEPDTEDLSF